MKHTLVVIGWMGVRHAYLDISREDAIRRELERQELTFDQMDSLGTIEEFQFDDVFGVYDAWDLRDPS